MIESNPIPKVFLFPSSSYMPIDDASDDTDEERDEDGSKHVDGVIGKGVDEGSHPQV